MLRFKNILVVTALALFATSCIEPEPDEVLVTPVTKVDVDAAGATVNFEIQANFAWSLEMTDTWYSITPIRYFGDRIVQITVQPNTELTARSSTFSIVGETTSRDITISQAGEAPLLTVASSQVQAVAAGQNISVEVTTNVDITATPQDAWITYTETKLVGTKQYVFAVAPNTSLQERQGVIKFAQNGGSLSAQVTVVQAGEAPAFAVDKASFAFDANGGQDQFQVTANIPWVATSSTTWAHALGTKLMENQPCLVVVDTNARVEPRNAVITVVAPDYPALDTLRVAVSQEGAAPWATFTPQAIVNVPAAVDTVVSVQVSANFDWKVDTSATADWVRDVHVTQVGLTFGVSVNDDIQPRSTAIDVWWEDGTYRQKLTISQLAGESRVELPNQLAIPEVEAKGGTMEIPVTSNVDWEASVSQDWLTVVETKAQHSGVITLSVSENISTEDRMAILVVTTQETNPKQITRYITQRGGEPFITISPDSLIISSAAGAHTVTVRSNVPWAIVAQPIWMESSITLTTVSDTEKQLTFAVQANSVTTPRSGSLQLRITNGTATATLFIQQEAEAEYLKAELSTIEPLNNEGDTFSLWVETNMNTVCSFDGAVSWLSLSSTLSEGRTTTYTYQASAVPTTAARQAKILIKDAQTGVLYKSFTVSQRGARVAAADSLALVAFYNRTAGANWRDTYLWNLDLPVASWPGVTLETAVREGALHVKALQLPNARLAGTIGDVLGTDPLSCLVYLETLDLSNNSALIGSLPISWTALANLQSLDVSWCNITNSLLSGFATNIPAEYGGNGVFIYLTTFKVNGNLLSGIIPTEVAAHPNFSQWNFAQNIAPQKTATLTLPVAESEAVTGF